MKESWKPTFPNGYSPRTPGTQPLAALRDMRMTITRAKHNSVIASAVAATVGISAPAGNRARTVVVAAITTMRGEKTRRCGTPHGHSR